jgi:hypothetical protein
MSVEGIVPIFCVPEPACVANRATGNCPDSQGGLPWGSYCDVITRTGQYGCKPFNGTNIRNSMVYPAFYLKFLCNHEDLGISYNINSVNGDRVVYCTVQSAWYCRKESA